MNPKLLITLLLGSLLFTACAGAGSAATPTAEAIPPVLADSTIIAEGRLEPVHFTEIAFTASGRVSDILVTEGQQVSQGEELIRLGDASDTQYAAAQLGQVMFGATLDYQYNWMAVLTWLGVVVLVSILASVLPARGATQISVRDSLAYA